MTEFVPSGFQEVAKWGRLTEANDTGNSMLVILRIARNLYFSTKAKRVAAVRSVPEAVTK